MKTSSQILLTALVTLLSTVFTVHAAHAEGGGQNQFPCTSSKLRPGALYPDLVPDPDLLIAEHVVWRDPQTGQFLLAFSAGIINLGAGTLNVVGYRDPVAGSPSGSDTMPAYQRIFHKDGSCDEC